jgi:hypothetical protein
VFDIKISGTIGGIALILSSLIGLISGAGFATAFLRALVFGAVFFVLSGGIHILASRFLPELLENGKEDQAGDALGSHVNLTLEDGDGQDEIENISDLIGDGLEKSDFSGGKPMGLDQKGEDRYTKRGGAEENFTEIGEAAVPDSSETVDVLPDLDSLAASFIPSPSTEDEGEVTAESFPKKAPSTNSKSQNMQGDFQPKELASAIQTILKRE